MFDSGANHSFMSLILLRSLGMTPSLWLCPLIVEIAGGRAVIVFDDFRGRVLEVSGVMPSRYFIHSEWRWLMIISLLCVMRSKMYLGKFWSFVSYQADPGLYTGVVCHHYLVLEGNNRYHHSL